MVVKDEKLNNSTSLISIQIYLYCTAKTGNTISRSHIVECVDKNSVDFYLNILLQAFAWYSDLLVEHAEIFWALFAVDMDRILAEQPPDTWDSFPLFQILNDYLRTDGKF